MPTKDPNRVVALTPTEFFWKLLTAAGKGAALDRANQRTWALDPGETTGSAYWTPSASGGTLHVRQFDTSDVVEGFQTLYNYAPGKSARHLRVEDYRVYGWKAEDHSWAALHTPQFIGAIKVMAHLNAIPLSFMMAQQAKKMLTDDKLKLCGLYEPGLKHGRDAIRHLVYYLMYGETSK